MRISRSSEELGSRELEALREGVASACQGANVAAMRAMLLQRFVGHIVGGGGGLDGGGSAEMGMLGWRAEAGQGVVGMRAGW